MSHYSTSIIDHAWNGFEVVIGSLARRATEQSSPPPPLPPPREPRGSPSPSGGRQKRQAGENDKEIDFVVLGIELALRLFLAVASGYLVTWITRKMLQPSFSGEQEMDAPTGPVSRRLAEILSKRNGGKSDGKETEPLPELSRYELQMAQEIVDPDDIETTFSQIGGLDETKREIYELAILPLVQPHLFKGKLVQPCKGILLYGKPGTGKTMLAKALAKEARAVFLPLQLSKILNKWVGESNKLVAAAFSLANKLQPAIIFIDELDTFLKASTSETAYLDSIKAEFLTLWDGVSTSSNSRVLVLGATNKPQNIDSAILRRMPRAFNVPLPNRQGRLSILTLLVRGENVTQEAVAFLPELSRLTEGYSGSDLMELCKAAAMIAVQERTKQFARDRVMGIESDIARIGNVVVEEGGDSDEDCLRPISKDDLLAALEKVQRTGAAAHAYGEEERRHELTDELSYQPNSLRGLAALLRSLSVVADNDGGTGPPSRTDSNNGSDNDDEDGVPEL